MMVPAQIQGCDAPTVAPQPQAPAQPPARAQASAPVTRGSKTIFGMDTVAILPPQYLPLLGRKPKQDWAGRSAPAWVWEDVRDPRDGGKSTKIPPPRIATRTRSRIPLPLPMSTRGRDGNPADAFTAANIPPPRPLNLPAGLGTDAANPPRAILGENLPPLPAGMTR